jgi:ribosomal-protein-alanine acetyltransferase
MLDTATMEDLSALVALENACSRHPWNACAFRAALREHAGSVVLVLRRMPLRIPFDIMRCVKKRVCPDSRSALVAFCVLQTVADELHVHKLCIQTDRRRQGLGRRMLESALSLGAQRGARRAFLELRASNIEARRLYSALGFRCIARRADYYDQPVEDALIMEKADLGVDEIRD